MIVRPSALGDVCRTVPVLVSLKRAWPAAQIDWLVQDSFAGAIAGHPDLHQIIPFPRSGLRRWWTPSGLGLLSDLLTKLRANRYDLVLDCQGLLRSGLLTRATGAPIRLGHADAREMGTLGYTHPIAPGGAVHTVDRMLTLVAALGILSVCDLMLHPDPAELARLGADSRFKDRFAVLAPTSRWPGKRWPADRFAELASRLLAESDLRLDRVVIVGSTAERPQCEPLLALAAREPRVVDLIGGTSVAGLLALISRSSLVIANDSAALHMAVGCRRPLVALYGPTDVAQVGPFGRASDVLQHLNSPAGPLDHKNEAAGRELMERISTDEVLAAARRALARERVPAC